MNRLGQSLNVNQIKARFLFSKYFPISVFQEMIICADIDEDGKISFDEFKKLMLNPFS